MKNYLSIIQYDSPADQVFLVKNTTEIYQYSENPETGINAMIALLSSDQLTTLQSHAYTVQPIDTNPNMQQYLLLESNQDNQSSSLAYLGEVYGITNKLTLVKLKDKSSFESFEGTKISNQFKILGLNNIRETIAEKNEVSISIKPSPSTIEKTPKEAFNMTYLLIGVGILVVLLIVFAFVWFRRRKQQIIS